MKTQRKKHATADKVDAQGTGEHLLSFCGARTASGYLTPHKGETHTPPYFTLKTISTRCSRSR